MADIYDTLHPVNTPADNLYPNIKPEQNIPDASISKQKLNFSIGGQGAAAILPGEEYVDIAYNGNPGSVLFPKGTYFIYTRDGWLNNTPPYTGTYNTVSDDFEVMAYWYDVSENVIKSSEATPSNDGIILSIPEDDFLVMVLIKNPNENGPRVIPVYSIIPTSLLKYNTRDYDWASLQVTGFTINDGEYPQLGSGYLVDQFSTPIVSANTNYYKICNMKILSADIGRDTVSASAIVWIAATTGSTINTAFVSLNLVMDTLTHDYSASGATIVGGAFDSGKLVYVVNFDDQQSTLTIELYAALSKDAMLAAGNVCYVRYRDAQGDRQSTVPVFYGTDTGSASAPSNSIPVKQIGTAFDPDGTYPSLMAGGVQCTQLYNNADLNDCVPENDKVFQAWVCSSNGISGTVSNTPFANFGRTFYLTAVKTWYDAQDNSRVRVVQTLYSISAYGDRMIWTRSIDGAGTLGWSDWKEIVVADGSYPNMGAGYLAKTISVATTNNSAQYGWWRFASLPFSSLTPISGNSSYSAILLVNAVNPCGINTNNAYSGLIELDLRLGQSTPSSPATNDVMKVLCGSISPKDFCCVVGDSQIDFYTQLSAAYVRRNFTVFDEVYQDGIKVNALEFEATFVSSSAPSGAVYAVVRNNASTAESDGDGNNISKTYAPIASPKFTGTPTAPTPPAGDNSTRIATTGWVQSTSGAKTAYHHHVQALIQSTLPEGASNYRAQCYFEIVTDSSAPITTAAELYNALMSLEYNATETRYTPASGGMWVTTIPEPPTSGVNADVIVGIRATDKYEPQNPETDSRAIVVQQYRVGLSSLDGPFYNVPFYYAGLSTSKFIHDTVTDQYGNYIAGGD